MPRMVIETQRMLGHTCTMPSAAKTELGKVV
jgi:hypothetical protein